MGAGGRAVRSRRLSVVSRLRGIAVLRPDGGSGTVLAVGVVAGLVTVLLAALALVAVLVAGQGARTAADLAALAAEGQLVVGADAGTACGAAAEVAGRNQARLVSCTTVAAGAEPWPRAVVTVIRAVPGLRWEASARAVAGGVLREESGVP